MIFFFKTAIMETLKKYDLQIVADFRISKNDGERL